MRGYDGDGFSCIEHGEGVAMALPSSSSKIKVVNEGFIAGLDDMLKSNKAAFVPFVILFLPSLLFVSFFLF